MSKDPRLFLEHILNEIDFLEEIAQGKALTDFQSDAYFRHAVERAFEIIGEAVSNLPEDLKSQYPEVPWMEVRRTRNVVAHIYWGISLHYRTLCSEVIEFTGKACLLV